MTIPLPIALCVFDTTKGHFGRRDIYCSSIASFQHHGLLSRFSDLLVHVKVTPGEEAVFEEQRQFYSNLGFTVLHTVADWKHHDVSHQRGYSADLVTVYGYESIQNTPFALHWESDWSWDVRGDRELLDYIEDALSYLNQNPHIMAVRFPRFLNEVERLRNLHAKHGLNVTVRDAAPPFTDEFYEHNDNLSLNPSLFRTRDLFWATRLLKANFDHYSQHVEHYFTQLVGAPALIDGKMSYAIYNPLNVGVLHLGTKIGEEDATGGVSDTL